MKSNEHTQLKEREKQKAVQGQTIYLGRVEILREYVKYPVMNTCEHINHFKP